MRRAVALLPGLTAGVLSGLAAGCTFPTEGSEEMPNLDRGAFVAEVQPIFEARCANPSCHGRPERALSTYAVGRYRADPGATYSGEPLTEEEIEHNYLASCVLSIFDERPEEAQLAAKPLGKPVYHGGGAVFEDERDADHRTIVRWISAGPGAP